MPDKIESDKARSTFTKKPQIDHQLRNLVWLYIFLLIFEGAMRKWLLPSLSDPLLLIRDPVVLISYALAIIHHRFPVNGFVISGTLLVIVCTILATLVGHGNFAVSLFGVRANFLHIPFAFIIGNVLNRDDVIRLGRWWLWGSIAMTALIVLQFEMPQSAWINRAVGGGEGGGFSGAMGRSRPPATFSFIIGTVQFFTITAVFLIAGLTQHNRYSKLLLALATGAMIVAIPVSISRSLILACAIVFIAGIGISALQKGTFSRVFRVGIIAAFALFIAFQIPVFDDAREAFMARWENSTGEKRGGFNQAIIGRVLEMFTGPFKNTGELPIFGHGIGAGTPVGSKFLTGEQGFSLGESEWYRLFGEYGLALGLLFIAWRLALCFKLGVLGLRALARGNGLGLIFLSASAVNIVTGQLSQTSINGFTTLGIGLTIASMRIPKQPSAQKETTTPEQKA